jgi:asparagine synthase (glutamine-hydrolysing)
MNLAEKYRHLPGILRKHVVENAVNMLPLSDSRRDPVARAQRFIRAASLPKVERYLRWVSSFDEAAKARLYSRSFLEETKTLNTAGILAPWFAKANGSGIIDAALLTDTMTYLPNDLLVKVDIASMAVSLEARSPFLDHHLIEFAASLPENLKIRGLTTKYLLKNVLKKILPAENLNRPKMGFGVPIGHWFRGRLKGFLQETLLSEKSLGRDLFAPAEVSRIVTEHVAGKRDHAHQLWTLLMLELWFQRFID